MKHVVVIGAGKIGATISDNLAATGDYRVTLADRLVPVGPERPGAPVERVQLDVADRAGLEALLAGKFAVLSAAPFHLTTTIAEAAAAAGIHYLDLTEDVASTRRVKELAASAGTAFIPQCGLAPGAVSIIAADMARRFDRLDSIRLRVGALPRFPANGLGYSLTWSTDGVINEYCEPCEAIVDGALRQVPPLEEREEFTFDGVAYEAFNTSGGLGTLCETYAGRVRELNYRTIRYPGHAAVMKLLLRDLRLSERRGLMKEILEGALPSTLQDVVVIIVTVAGYRDGRLIQESYANRIGGDGRLSAIQLTTAAGICAVLDLLGQGRLPQHGFVRQEDVDLAAFLGNRFGRVYAADDRSMRQAPMIPLAAE